MPSGDVGRYACSLLEGIDRHAGTRAPTTLQTRSAELLFGRAAITGAHRDGATATGGTARMVPASDGWVAINLARPADLGAVTAITGSPDGGDPFGAIAAWATSTPASEAAERMQLFGVPAGVVGSADANTAVVRQRVGPQDAVNGLRIADLTSLWAGPTCGRLLARSGARVTKIESVARPDGARRGPPAFYEWLHAYEADAVAFDFTTDEGRAALRPELDRADVVLEASRPRALRQLGVVAEDWLAARPGRVWLSITGYGRDEADPGRVAFGDDAAAAGGLVAFEPGRDAPLFVGDAIADPLTGLTAAAAVLESLEQGGGELVSVALAGVAACVVARHPLLPGTVTDAAPPQPPKPDI